MPERERERGRERKREKERKREREREREQSEERKEHECEKLKVCRNQFAVIGHLFVLTVHCSNKESSEDLVRLFSDQTFHSEDAAAAANEGKKEGEKEDSIKRVFEMLST